MKYCCVTGHREIATDKIEYVEQMLLKEIMAAIDDGFTFFVSGFAPGADMIFSKLVIGLQKEHPEISLEAALPYPTWVLKRSVEEKDLLLRCITIKSHCPKYKPDCFFLRNRYMANTCERVIAVYDGRESGGTVMRCPVDRHIASYTWKHNFIDCICKTNGICV